MKDLKGLAVAGLDQQVGECTDVLFDDVAFSLRYFVVKTGGWLRGREVLIAPPAIKAVHPEHGLLVSNLTKKQIEDSPPLDSHPPVSRQYEELLHQYYEWPPYWGMPLEAGIGLYGMGPPPLRFQEPADPEAEKARSRIEQLERADSHLQSADDVVGYALHGEDGDVGHVKDFLIETTRWQIKYLVVETGHWFSSRKVVIDRGWIRRVDWTDRNIQVGLRRSDVEEAPPYHPEALGTTYEKDLTAYYLGLVDRWRATSAAHHHS
jgi:hypothetical protein